MSSFDKDTLHLLAIFHYVIAGIVALVACIPLIHLTIGISVLVGAVSTDEPAMGVAGAFFIVIASVIILVGWGMACFIFYAGKNLDRQTKYQMCMIGGGLLCIFMPLGTILGVFTLLALQDQQVKDLFAANESKTDNDNTIIRATTQESI